MIEQELKQKLMDMGALGYSDEKIMVVLDLSADDFSELMSKGGRDAYNAGVARFDFQVHRKLMEMAAKGDMKAMVRLENIRDENSRGRK